ncbi:MAG: ribonuclease R [Balneolales bacterium]|nr:ribonuclease R [Balneolales bacterium]
MTRNQRLTTMEEIIMDLVKNSPNGHLKSDTIEDVLQLGSKRDYKRFDKALNSLASKRLIAKDGGLIRLSKGGEKKKVPRNSRGLMEGRIQITSRGTGFVLIEGMDEDVRISRRDVGTSLSDDLVQIRLQGTNKRTGQPQGKVVEVLERGKDFYVGTLKRTGVKTFLIEPDLKSAHVEFFVQPENVNGAKSDDKVTFELLKWVHPQALPEASVTSILGKKGSNEANILSILAENELRADFPPEVEAYAENIPLEIPKEEIKKRRDLRDETIFTIDPVDAKDFDDALSITILDNGNFYLGVHIADVTAYMPKDSVLDEEAYKRATSIYLVDRVIPMLPERLSNGVCSLRPNEDKLCYSCFMEIDKDGYLVDYSIDETIIHSKHRFTYEQAQEVLDGEDHELKKELHLAGKLAKTLLKKRFKEGAIDFDTPEPRFVLDESGKPIEVVLKKRIFAHRLIEECMLMANRTVAMHIDRLRDKSGQKKSKNLFPYFYRVHDKPDDKKLAEVAEQVKPIGINFEIGNSITPKTINNLLEKVKGTPIELIVNELTLRAMAKAIYTPDNVGHFGLGFKFYAHFTSPIRRYPDVIVHRLLKGYASGGQAYNYESLRKHGEHCSARERVAVDAERDSIKLKQVEFLSDKIGETFEGVISGVTERGIFVDLKEIHCEGMIRVGDLKGDFFNYDQRSHSLVGRSSKKIYRLGDEIRISVQSVNHQKRQIDFIPA